MGLALTTTVADRVATIVLLALDVLNTTIVLLFRPGMGLSLNWNGPSPPWNGPRSFPRGPWACLGLLGPHPPNANAWCPTCLTTHHSTATCLHRYGGPDMFPSFAGS